MAEVPQFFEMPLRQYTDWEAYSFPGRNPDELTTVIVECAAGGGSVARDAGMPDGYRPCELVREFTAISDLANVAIGSMRARGIQEGEIAFGVELGGAAGVPFITKGEAKGNFRITLRWKDIAAGL